MDTNIKFYKVSREEFFNSFKFTNKASLIRAVKEDWNRMNVIINSKKYKNYIHFLEIIKDKYNNYLEIILLLCNQCAYFYNYNKIFSIITEYGYHCSTTNKNYIKVTTRFNITPMIKQAIITNTYDVFKVVRGENQTDMKIFSTMIVSTIIDLSTVDPVVVKLEFLEK